MINKSNFLSAIILCIVFLSFTTATAQKKDNPKKIYFSYTLHGNMNYDRYPASTIWEKFPETYINILNYIEARPDFKGQMQLSGQTFKTLQLTAPEFLENSIKLQKAGQIDITGTFYSEPVNVCMDGETNLQNAIIGTEIINKEMVKSSGFFIQESAWNPQMPFILKEAGVDWTPVRMTEHKYFNAFLAVGLDGTKIPAIIEMLRHGKAEYKRLIKEAPDNSIFLIGGDYEMPERFVDAYEVIAQINKEDPTVSIEWIRVSDYLKMHPAKEEVFINNADLAGVKNWDSYSRWTADPYDIQLHTITKKAMEALRAAKIAVFASQEYAKSKGISGLKNPDLPVESIKSFESNTGIDWDIEKISSYPTVEPNYFTRDGKVTMLSRAEHLLAWAVNSDARGWWPLYERRLERQESFQRVIDISEELIKNSLAPVGSFVKVNKDLSNALMIFNAEKERISTIELTVGQPYVMTDAEGKEFPTKIFKKGNEYLLKAEIGLPEYGYKVVGLKKGGVVETPVWKEGREVRNERFLVKANDDNMEIIADGRSFKLSLDTFQIRLMAEMVFLDRFLEGWRKGVQHGPTRVSVCTNDINPKIRVDRQVDWAVHMRQEYEITDDHVNCKWSFFMPYPTLIRQVADIDPLGREGCFLPEGLVAKLETNTPGKVYYEVPYGVTDHIYPDPSYVTMLNFALLQQAEKGVMLVAKTGSQAVGVNQGEGVLNLTLGTSGGSGPIRNPKMEVNGFDIYHERPFYAEPFKDWYHHEFAIFPFTGNWQDINASKLSRAYVNDLYKFELQEVNSTGSVVLPQAASLVSLNNDDVEITMIDKRDKEFFIRLNERDDKKAKGKVIIGNKSIPFKMSPFEIKKVSIK